MKRLGCRRNIFYKIYNYQIVQKRLKSLVNHLFNLHYFKFMTVLELLKGKHIMVKTDVGAIVELEIKEVVENQHSQQIGESNAANDWWPDEKTWTTYTVYFTNGGNKEYQSLNEIKVH